MTVFRLNINTRLSDCEAGNVTVFISLGMIVICDHVILELLTNIIITNNVRPGMEFHP